MVHILIYVKLLFMFSDTGKVLKAIVNGNRTIITSLSDIGSTMKDLNLNESIISQSWDIFDEPIKSLVLLSPKRLLVSTESDMKIISVDNCNRFKRCGQCLEIRDPHCVWWIENNVCISHDSPELAENEDYNVLRDFGSGGGDVNVCPPGK